MNSFEVLINDEIQTYGLISYNIKIVDGEIIKEGIFKTHLYVEEIYTLACDKFRLDGVEVHTEASGSNDVFYIYAFTYEGFEILNNGSEYNLEELLELYKEEVK